MLPLINYLTFAKHNFPEEKKHNELYKGHHDSCMGLTTVPRTN